MRNSIRSYIVDNLLLGAADHFADGTSLMEEGILDSTGAIELVAFLETTFDISIASKEIIPDNLDSVDRICAMVERKVASNPAG